MKKEVQKEIFQTEESIKIPQYKKIWMSITKFEKYPEMAAEGLGRSFGYLAFLIFIYVIILSLGLTYMLNMLINQTTTYIDENFTSINYEDGSLNIELADETNTIITDLGTVIIDTSDVSEETLAEYEDTADSASLGIIWLKDYVSICGINYGTLDITYEEIFDEWNIQEFDKAGLLELIETEISVPFLYFACFIVTFVIYFAIYFIETLVYTLILSVVGILISMIAKLKIKYKALFSMSIYAMTLSVVLSLIYEMVYMFAGFEIKYFDLMYSAISYICLTAAIFMIKSDIVRQQSEMMKIMTKEDKLKEAKKEEEEKEQEKKEKEERQNKDKQEDKQDNDNKEKNKTKDDKKDGEIEQGSNA